jgi:uncharacterized membrane protein YhaH (DUF805 family)
LSSSGRLADASAVLYLVPFVVSGAYGLYLWARAGASAFVPPSVYLGVTRDPYVFMAGSLAVALGIVLDMRGADPSQRRAKLTSIGGTLQSVAVASFVLALVSAFYANRFVNVGGAADDFVVGRYGLVFPALMVLFSYLITARFDLRRVFDRGVISIIALLLVPVSIYEIGKHQVTVGLGLALILIIIGLGGFVMPKRAPPPEKESPG